MEARGKPRWMSRRLLTIAAAALALAANAGCDDNDDHGSTKMPEGTVAVVGDREISTEDLDRRMAVLRREDSRAQEMNGSGPPKTEGQLKRLALSALLMESALEQEAAAHDIKVGLAQARRRWADAAQAQFRTKQARRRFLRGQSEQSLVRQLRLQMITDRIHAQIAEEAGGGRKGEVAVRRFQKRYRKRWTDRTACKDADAARPCPKPD